MAVTLPKYHALEFQQRKYQATQPSTSSTKSGYVTRLATLVGALKSVRGRMPRKQATMDKTTAALAQAMARPVLGENHMPKSAPPASHAGMSAGARLSHSSTSVFFMSPQRDSATPDCEAGVAVRPHEYGGTPYQGAGFGSTNPTRQRGPLANASGW